jgi:hypothetical protein
VRVLPDAAIDLVFNGGRLMTAGPDVGPSVEQLSAGLVLGFNWRTGPRRRSCTPRLRR